VCELLWTGALATPPPAIAPLAGSLPDRQARAEEPLHRLVRVVVGALARENLPEGVARSLELERARALALALARAAGAGRVDAGEADPARIFLASHGVAPTAARRRLLDATLVLTADHELNASTFAARIAASTGADLHACVLAALAAFLGPRHGLASRRLEALLATLRRPAHAAALVRSRTALGQEMPGFGHPLYPDGDPRARALLSLCARLTPAGRRARLDALIAATERQRGERPNIDAALVAVALGLGLPAGSAAVIFAVARVAGWVAHIFEQRASPAILRPRAQYVP
jgi:citrate synthase